MKQRLGRFISNRYTYLFASILILLLIEPFTHEWKLPLPSFMTLLVILSVLWTLELKKSIFFLCVSISSTAFLLDLWDAEQKLEAFEGVSAVIGFLTTAPLDQSQQRPFPTRSSYWFSDLQYREIKFPDRNKRLSCFESDPNCHTFPPLGP